MPSEELQQGLKAAMQLLALGGHLAVISFHSLEDRIVKTFINTHSKQVFDRRAPFRAQAWMLKAMPLKSVAACSRARPRLPPTRARARQCCAWRNAPRPLMLTKINLLLLALVMGFGMPLVQTSYEARRLYSEVDRAKAEGERLAADAQRLAAERHQQSTSIRVEQVAREKMGMRLIAPFRRAAGGAAGLCGN